MAGPSNSFGPNDKATKGSGFRAWKCRKCGWREYTAGMGRRDPTCPRCKGTDFRRVE